MCIKEPIFETFKPVLVIAKLEIQGNNIRDLYLSIEGTSFDKLHLSWIFFNACTETNYSRGSSQISSQHMIQLFERLRINSSIFKVIYKEAHTYIFDGITFGSSSIIIETSTLGSN